MAEIVECLRKYEDEIQKNLLGKVWALINQVFPRFFLSYCLWLTSQIIELVDISESIDINQSISSN